jgi:hypothetical protein
MFPQFQHLQLPLELVAVLAAVVLVLLAVQLLGLMELILVQGQVEQVELALE